MSWSVALQQANAAKLAGARLRAQIHSAGRRGGAVRAAQAVQAADSSLRFYGLLQAVPQIGDTTARQMLGRAQINPAARVNSDLVDRRRRELLVGLLLTHANRPGGRHV